MLFTFAICPYFSGETSWVLLEILQVVEPALAYVGWSVLFGFFAYGTGIRANMREKYGINGTMFEDFFAVLLMYPLAAVQMDEHMETKAMLKNGDVELGKGNESCVGKSIESFALPEKKAPEDFPSMVVHQRHVRREGTEQGPAEGYTETTFI